MRESLCSQAQSGSVPSSLMRNAGEVGLAIRRSPGALAFPQHMPQAIHGFMVGLVQGVAPVREQLKRLPNPTRLVNAALLADGQMHREVKKRVLPFFQNLGHAGQRSIHIGQRTVVLWMLADPKACNGLQAQGAQRPWFWHKPNKKTA